MHMSYQDKDKKEMAGKNSSVLEWAASVMHN